MALCDTIYDVMVGGFEDFRIMKVFRGASNDVRWLKGALNIFVVNMFDAEVAARQHRRRSSYRVVLFEFCKILITEEEKRNGQKADWNSH